MNYLGNEINSTNAGSTKYGKAVFLITSLCMLNGGLGTGSVSLQTNPYHADNFNFRELVNTSIGLFSIQPQENTARSLFQFRQISGLTWDKIAEIFGVTRRAVHFWANGMQMEDYRAEKLYYLLDSIKLMDTGYAVENRRNLFAKTESGVSLFDLYKKGDFFQARRRVNSIPKATHAIRNLKPLSSEALANMEPQISPFDLLNSDNSRIKTKRGKVSLAKVRKIKHEG